MKKKAVIFDMDGVLVDSESVYLQLFRTFLEENQCVIDETLLHTLAGASSQRTWEIVAQMWKEEITPQEMRTLYKKDHPSYEIPYKEILYPGVKDLLVWLKQERFVTAIASSSSEESIQEMLRETELSSLFDCYVSGKWFKNSKPDPEIYLYTLDKLGLPAGDCIVVEDSAYGIQAAKAAGLTVAAVKDTKFGADQSAADYLIDRTCELKGLLELQFLYY
ncbi:MAG: HAD family phosphatase [Lachnospiraceae bacterium]|nr:HAD family phosphatase [Lachnospiraceae bacterium]